MSKVKKAFKLVNKKETKEKDMNFIPYMEMADDDIILYHRGKSFKQALSIDEALDLLREDGTIARTTEVESVLREHLEKMSA